MAMLVGMAAFEIISSHVIVLPNRIEIDLAGMAVCMTLPMVVWMRRQGHGWRACNEMAFAVGLPAAGALALLATNAVADPHSLLAAEHMAMFLSMLVLMVFRRNEYVDHRRAPTHTNDNAAPGEESAAARPV